MDSERGWTLLFWSMIILGVLAVLFRSGDIEQDLTDRANAVLHKNGLQWASVKETSGRNLVLTGESPVQDFRNLPKKMVGGLYGVRSIDDEDVSVKDPVSPYIWQAVIAEDSVVLKGFVPDDETRALIVKKAKQLIYDRPVIDKMILADGSPDSGWLDNISSVLKYTRYLKNGTISLEDRSVKVEGEAWSLLDHEIVTLRTGRGKAIGDYKFSSNLALPVESVKEQEVSDIEAEKIIKPEESETPADVENIPAATEDASAVEKESAAAAAPAPVTDTVATDAVSAASGNDAVAGSSKTAEKETLPKNSEKQNSPEKPSGDTAEESPASAAAESGNNAQSVEPPPAEVKKTFDKTASKTTDKTGGNNNIPPASGYYYVPGPYGAPVAVPLNVPPFMVAPPWAFSPYRAPSGYPPGCAYLHPGHPAYCGRALY